jgi:ketosteroid isomerase-like protein
MFSKKFDCSVWVLALCAMGAVTPAVAADASDLVGRAASWEKNFNADNLKGIVALYAADGWRMPPHEATAKGSEGILAELKSLKEHGASKVKITVTTGESEGSLNYGTGTFEVLGADGKQIDHGKWMKCVEEPQGTLDDPVRHLELRHAHAE